MTSSDPAAPGRDGAPRVTVIVLTHNRVAELLATLARLSVLSDRPAIVVVDNGSTDGTTDEIRRRFPAVEVVALRSNMGAAGRNAGVKTAKTCYVAFSDDDTWWDDGALTHAAALMEASPRLAVVTARVLVEPGGREDEACGRMAASPLGRVAGVAGARVLGFLAGASVMRRDAFLAAGGYQPRLFLGGEETLLAMDLASAGWQLAYVPAVIAHHAPSPLRDRVERRRLLLRNALWCAWLRLPWRSAAVRTAEIARRAREQRMLARTMLAAACGVPWVLRMRRVVPPPVQADWRLIEHDS
jgi:GT2 family glycosyltransferase